MNPRFFFAVAVMFAMAAALAHAHAQGTRLGFYARTCPRAESIVRSTVQSHFRYNPAIAPGLLRMHFHDCFVQGCDASILIDGPNSEKTAPPNRLLRGYEVIDDAKTQLEAACPGVVSCADILTLAARDSVFLTKGINWQVPTGRRDGRVSLASDTFNLPGFTESIDSQKQKFAAFGLNTRDLVALVGGHTIGTSACQFFSYRLYNFTNGGPDPTINPTFVPKLQALCPQNGDGSRRIDLDTGSGNKFDVSFFANLRNGRGILESDQKLWTDASTRSFVQRFLGKRGTRPLNFNVEFARSMVKMSNIGVKTGINGEIRKICSAFIFSYNPNLPFLYNFTTNGGPDTTINPTIVLIWTQQWKQEILVFKALIKESRVSLSMLQTSWELIFAGSALSMAGDCSKHKFFLVFVLFYMAAGAGAGAASVKGHRGTRVGFYSTSCPLAESIVTSTVQSHLQSDPSVGPAILRMHFHDCFVRGCDASILIDGPDSEKHAAPNLGVRGYEVIDDAKAQLEATCPGVVSCADVLALAARDAVFLAKGPKWDVPTGRRDGRISLASDADNLPSFADSIEELKRKFAAFGLNNRDLVTLIGEQSFLDFNRSVGAHTIGTTACQFFSYRLFNFTTTRNGADPSINPEFVSRLRTLCPPTSNETRRVALDMDSAGSFDTSFFKNLRKGRGILESDQRLWTDASTRSIVESYLGVRGLRSVKFNVEFGKSMVKMSNIQVKTGTDGEIRQICSAIN
ncbi:hypothetical protein GQ457_04G004000 [Hibiscus cannabinus]